MVIPPDSFSFLETLDLDRIYHVGGFPSFVPSTNFDKDVYNQLNGIYSLDNANNVNMHLKKLSVELILFID
jgi:hypothetical protein